MTVVTATSSPAPVAQVRRAELATFLRSRRERIAPQDVGLPPSLRRRTPGLRREEVAQLAGVGVTWYTWLEQGRQINASTQVLDSIARTLKLDRDEHQHLYRLADVPSVANPEVLDPVVSPEVRAILAEFSSLACVLNEKYDLLAWNRLYELVFPSVVSEHEGYRNILWTMFTAPGCCHPFVNRREETPRLVATLRAAYGRHVGEPGWERFIKSLIERSGEFAQLWGEHEVDGYSAREKVFNHPGVGLLRFTATSLGVHSTPGLRIVVYLAADEQTAKGVARLNAGDALRSWPQPCGHRLAAASA
jgi:transcriptional regulator with XRE-family HTH domain